FFFSSRRRHTRFSRDWSSDVCSSDLERPVAPSDDFADKPIRICAFYSPGHDYARVLERLHRAYPEAHVTAMVPAGYTVEGPLRRSEERRVGKEGTSRLAPAH